MKKYLIILFILINFLTIEAFAADNIFSSQLAAVNADSIENDVPDSAREYVSDIGVTDGLDIKDSIVKIVNKAKADSGFSIAAAIRNTIGIFIVSVICAVMTSLFQSTEIDNLNTQNTINLAGALSITIMSLSNINSILTQCRSAISDIDVFSKSLLPAIAAATAISGSPVSGAARYTATMLFSTLLITAITNIILPSIYIYIIIVAVNAALSNDLLSKVAAFIKWITTSFLKLILTVFVAYLSISGVVAQTTDSFTLKTTKFALSGAIPVVGGIISDAADTVLSGASMLKNSIGIFGLVVIFAICIIPFISIGMQYISYKCIAAISSPICSKPLSNLIDSISDGFGMALGMLGTCAMLLFISIFTALIFVRTS